MKTMQDLVTAQKDRIRKRAAEDRQNLRTLELLASVWPEAIHVSGVSEHSLYGSMARVKVGEEYQAYGQDETRLSMQELAVLLDALPPMPLYKIIDGCTSLRPDRNVTDEEAMGDNAKQVWGVVLEVEPGINAGCETQKVRWYTSFGEEFAEVSAVLRPDSWPIRVNANVRRDKRTGKALEVLECFAGASPNFPGHFWTDQRIKWAAGSSEYANKFTFYWLAIDDTQGAGKAWLETVCGLTD